MREYPRIAVYDGDLTRLVTEVDSIEFMTFPGGEPHIKLSPEAEVNLRAAEHVTIDCRPRNFTDLGYLMLLVDAIRRNTTFSPRIDLLMPYVPGARQDRGIPFTAGVIAKLITEMGFARIDIYDPHSPVILDELRRYTDTYNWVPELPSWPATKYVAVIAPDAGSIARATHMADRLGYPVDIIRCTKKRDATTGNLSGFELATKTLPEGTYLLFDDICDGGGTFNAVYDLINAEYTKQWGQSADIDLFVTHGIFSKGTDVLLEKFTTIYSTTSFISNDDLWSLGVIPVRIHDLENLT